MALTKITSAIIEAGAIDATALADNSITIAHLDCSDGTAGQFLKTDGSGTLSFDSVPAGYTDSDVDTKLAAGVGNILTTGYIAGPATFTIDPAAVGDNTGTLVVAGNLQVDGTTTTINSTTMTVDDLNITLASGAANAAAANGAGITVDGASATITYDGTNDEWDFNKNINVDTVYTGTGIVHDGDTDTSLKFLANRLYIDVGGNRIFDAQTGDVKLNGPDGASGIVVDTGGNVGIGASSPTVNLDVYNGSGWGGLDIDGTSGGEIRLQKAGTRYGGIYANDSTGLVILAENGADATLFYTGGSERMRINSSGNVGIGTDSPSALLHIKTADPATNQAVIDFRNPTYGIFAQTNSINSRGNTLEFIASDYNNNSPTTHNVITMRPEGNVGIGDVAPPSKLTVTGGNTGFVASNGAGITGIQVSRTTSYGENLYMYTTSGTGWSNSSYVGRVESYGTNAMEIGSQQNAVVSFGTNNTEVFRLRSDGLQFPDNNTFIATSSAPGGSVYEWGAFRRPASSDGGQLTVRQYSSGDTAANYPAYASSNGSGTWDENTGVYFRQLDQVGLTANGNPTLTIEDGTKHEVYESGFTSGDDNRGQRVCLGGIAHNPSSNPGGTGSGAYLHIKTNVPKSNIMFRFEYKGYSYDQQNMDTSITGYTYTGVSYVYSPTIQDTGDTTYNFKTPYYSSDNKLVLVLQIASNYTGGILWAQFVGSHTMAPFTVAIASTAYSSSTSGAF